MANILIFNSIVPYPAEFNGNTIRVLPLSRELAKRHCCYLVAFGKEDEASQKLRESRVYEDVALLSPPDGRRSLTRHFHIKTGNQTRVALPTEFRRIVRTLKQYVDKWRIDLAIIHTSSLAEYVEAFKEFPMVLDAIDCNTLALGRKWRQELSMHGLIEAIKSRLVLERCRFLESRLTNIFDLVTVVSPVDRDYLRGLCPRGGERIIDIPNGVSPAVFDDRGKPTEVVPGGIAFWGALDFPPNTSAVHYFYDEVFLPFLAGKDIIWYIIGKNPSPKMEKMANKHRNIRLTGYVDDLYALVSCIPLMVNPMRMGAGLKNKVIEAFALERTVVSNRLGIEAIGSAHAGTHYVHAENPCEFAEAIMKYSINCEARKRIGREAKVLVEKQYTWMVVGEQYLDLVDGLIHGKDGRQASTHGS